ncbi:hypothetical protein Forpe1208_v011979 [Fusarium oxysporum f. sp. rapae]|uniref:Uncharacterized protein n=1 Tax=Fusarium oxysporum f. sp. rapae TaxID=485398 RepID=A0A8J5NNI9_FUSOX|nr:hypothetical protein Forpe1208_v011979 [Fusarium oxysporum f. sp. rapae]
MRRYDGTGFTRVEPDYSKPWLPGESRPETTPGEDYSRPWLPAAPADQLMMNAAARVTNKNEPKSKNDGVDKSKGKKKTAPSTTIDSKFWPTKLYNKPRR